jgi:3-isopropylmalate/(R)-2-methylmalate dehydratase small subunit
MILKGKVWKFGDDISTDLIAPGRLFHLRSNLPELAKHVLEDADPEFSKKLAGVSAVLAKSFARIFFRNSINVGLPVLICDTDRINQGDELEVDLEKGTINDLTQHTILNFTPLPQVMIKILKDGGLLSHIEKHGDFKLE